MLVTMVPGWRIHNVRPIAVLSVELPTLASPEPAPVVVPPRPEHKTRPRPVALERVKSEFVVPKAPEIPKASEAPSQAVAAIDEAPAEVPGEGKSASTEPAKPAVSAISVAEAVWLDGYGRTLSTLIARFQRYPHVALLRGWQGTAQLQLVLSATGKVLSTVVLRSSGFEVLDNQALEMVQRAAPFPQAPQALRGREVTVTVPIVFKLND